ncbi:MAG: carboxypeptidase regulatory-like domain-containing protein [Planctomycetes bacterium]|nr:carboxypeptidase regulatory-like domain-containing protein [Planctomycetota bacterium]
MTRSLVAMALVLVLAGLLLWVGLRSDAAPGAVATDVALRDAVVAPATLASADPSRAFREERQAVTNGTGAGAATPAVAGSLLVHLVWDDRTPAQGVTLFVQRMAGESTWLPVGSWRGDGAGDVRIDDLLPGELRLQSDRGGRQTVTVRAGERQDVTFPVPAGIAVHGIVREPAGGVVAGAEIWLTTHATSWLGGSVVGTSAADGTFALRDVPESQSLGALVAGRAPSALVDLEQLDTAISPVRIELIVGDAGGALTGRVVDAQGAGVADARIAVGKVARFLDMRSGGGMVEAWSPRLGVTAAEGAFAIQSIRPGRHPVEVFAPGHAFWHGECEIVAQQTSHLEVRLPAAMTVVGTVTDGKAVPMPGAIVRAFPVAIDESFLQFGQYDYDSAFGHPVSVADAAGRYELRCVSPGKVWLYACPSQRHDREVPQPRASTMLEGDEGARLRWDPRIDEGHVIEGVVLHQDRVPMDGLFVSAIDGEGDRQAVVTDPKGRFRFINLRAQPYDLAVQFWNKPADAPPLGQREVWPDRGEVELIAGFAAPKKVAPGRVRGVVQDGGARLGQGKMSVILARDRSWRTDAKIEGMAFAFGSVEPGRHQVVVMRDDAPVLFSPQFELVAGEDKDVGTLITQPGGRVRLLLQRQPGTEAATPTVWVTLVGHGHGHKVEPAASSELWIDNLSPGLHRLYVSGDGVARAETTCEVLAGGEVTASMTLRAATQRVVIVDYEARQQFAHMQVTASTGESFFDFRPEGDVGRPFRITLSLPLGDYTLVVESGSGQRAQTAFSVTSLAGEQPVVRLALP